MARSRAPSARNRGDETKAALVEAAIELFGRWGFEAVTTRAISARADVNLSSIRYHFGGKEKLYRAALVGVVAEIQALLNPALSLLVRRVEESGGDRRLLEGSACEFAENWCRAALGDRHLQRRVPCIVRELIAPSSSFSILYDGFFRLLYSALARLIGAYHGAPIKSLQTNVRTHALVNVLLGFVQAESVFLRLTGWKRYTPDRISALLPTLSQTFVSALR